MRRGVLLVPVALALAGAVEVVVFILVTRWLGLPAAMLLFLAMSVLGVVLLRREGVRAWRRFRAAAEAGQPPGVRVADGLVGLVGGLLLAVPGFVSGVLGLGLLLPPSRSLARRAVQRVAERRMPSMVAGDVFGPRRVRVRRGPAQPASPPPAAEPAGGDAARPAIEGEIVGPEDQSGPPPRH